MVTRDLVDLIGGHGPDHAVGTDRPRAAAAGVLDYASGGVDFLHQRHLRGLGLHVGHRQDYRIADVASPDSAPGGACAQSRVRLDGVDHFIETEIIDRLVQAVGCLECGIGRQIVLSVPFAFDAHIVAGLGVIGRDDPFVGRRPGSVLSLDDRVTLPRCRLR